MERIISRKLPKKKKFKSQTHVMLQGKNRIYIKKLISKSYSYSYRHTHLFRNIYICTF